MIYTNPLSYTYLTSLTNIELIEVEALCIATQDTLTLKRIELIRQFRNSDNRDS